MKDIREPILEQLVIRLKPIGLPVKSFVPNNHKTPYFYIGDIVTYETENKESFQIAGIFTVELWSGTNEWKGSLKQPLKWLDEAKVRVQPTTRTRLDVSPYWNMHSQRLDNDQGLQQFGQTQRNWVAQVQYEFRAMQVLDAIDEYNVIHAGDNVTHNGSNVTHITYIKYTP